ncbi:citrate reductase cytochrome c-type subunit [Escherichia coli]|uniref:Periplasmic nitrate reductase, electron transfer subunit n=1 Tax=Escherichia coli TaxID=562 RepID=A0A377B803_ECOLX|nr:citrate reductase cytochrome c-type subunit [Escherichia coli]
MPKEQERMPLNYVNQPPMIPHSVEGYQVTTNTNRCLQCHGVESYRTTARRVSVLLTLWTATAKWARKWLRVVISVCNVTYRRPIPRQSWGIPLPHQKVTGNKRLLWEILTVSLV